MSNYRLRSTVEKITLVVEHTFKPDGNMRTCEKIGELSDSSYSTAWKYRGHSVKDLQEMGVFLSEEQKTRVQYAIENPGEMYDSEAEKGKKPMTNEERQSLANKPICDNEIIDMYNKKIKKSKHELTVAHIGTLVSVDSDLEEIVTFNESNGTYTCNRTHLLTYFRRYTSDYFISIVEAEIFKTAEKEEKEEAKEYVPEPMFKEIKKPVRNITKAQDMNSYLDNLSASLDALALAYERGNSKTINAKLAEAKLKYKFAKNNDIFFYDHGLEGRFEKLERRFNKLKTPPK